MHRGIRYWDYVSFLVEADADLFQTHYLEEWNTCVVNRLSPADAKRFTRVHALGAGKQGRRRYVLSIAGHWAHLVTHLPFAKWADNLTRADVRATMYDCRGDTFERLCLALENAETRNNIESFKVARRTKSNARDAGGRGVRFGSRKSDVSSKVYRRGKENPAIETQVQDDRLGEAVLDALEALEGPGMQDQGWEILISCLSDIQDRHFNQWFFASKIEGSLDKLSHENIPMPKHIKETYQLEIWAGGAPLPEPPNEDAAYQDMAEYRED
jgi:hypothetical protein